MDLLFIELYWSSSPDSKLPKQKHLTYPHIYMYVYVYVCVFVCGKRLPSYISQLLDIRTNGTVEINHAAANHRHYYIYTSEKERQKKSGTLQQR